MVLYILEHGLPLDEVMFYDTGMEFEAIYRIRDKLLPILASRGIRCTELSPPMPFLYDMLERPVVSKQNSAEALPPLSGHRPASFPKSPRSIRQS